jgi:hypothetical protein
MKLSISPGHRLCVIVLLSIASAACEQVGDVASGAGSATKDLAKKITGGTSPKDSEATAGSPAASPSDSGVIGDSGPEDSGDAQQTDNPEDAESDAEVASTRTGNGDFNLVFEQSFQSCASCGIWFDSAELVIEHSEGRFSARRSGSLLIKEAPYHQGRFKADISAIPPSADIHSATLYMHLNRHEGISNDDFTSSLSVFGYVDGSLEYIREITAQHDIKGRGYSKANPVVPIDFTDYARRI